MFVEFYGKKQSKNTTHYHKLINILFIYSSVMDSNLQGYFFFLPIAAEKDLPLKKKYLGFTLKYLLVQEATYRNVLALCRV